jgi:SAM-dependent methyltransferase
MTFLHRLNEVRMTRSRSSPDREAEGVEFDPRAYWERRLGERFSLEGVGWIGLGPAFNGWMYRVRRRVFLRTLRPLLPGPESMRVLDIGSGTGFFIACWHELGVPALAGADITQTAVDQLRRRFPKDRFERLDLGSTELPFEEASFDAISSIDVLYHIVDDARFRQAFANVFSLLVPGGVFVFSENFVHGPTVRGEHQVSRSIGEVEAAVSAAGFEVLVRRPMFVLFDTPLDTSSRLLRAWWWLLSNAASRSNLLGGALGALAYPVELTLVSRLREGPSTEVVVCRRPAGSATAATTVAAERFDESSTP